MFTYITKFCLLIGMMSALYACSEKEQNNLQEITAQDGVFSLKVAERFVDQRNNIQLLQQYSAGISDEYISLFYKATDNNDYILGVSLPVTGTFSEAEVQSMLSSLNPPQALTFFNTEPIPTPNELTIKELEERIGKHPAVKTLSFIERNDKLNELSYMIEYNKTLSYSVEVCRIFYSKYSGKLTRGIVCSTGTQDHRGAIVSMIKNLQYKP